MKALRKLIGERIRERRKAVGLSSQEALAKILDIERTRVSRWETGEHIPEAEMRAPLAAALQTTEDKLFGTEGLETARPAQEAIELRARVLNAVIPEDSVRMVDEMERMGEGKKLLLLYLATNDRKYWLRFRDYVLRNPDAEAELETLSTLLGGR